jgi:hypothetical protein
MFTDLKNAYQTVQRAEALQKLLSKQANGYEEFFSAYGQQAYMWYFGMGKCAGAIISIMKRAWRKFRFLKKRNLLDVWLAGRGYNKGVWGGGI